MVLEIQYKVEKEQTGAIINIQKHDGKEEQEEQVQEAAWGKARRLSKVRRQAPSEEGKKERAREHEL